MENLHKARMEMMEAAGRTAHSFGLNRSLGHLYMFLYLHEDSCSLDELVDGLGISKASVSIACRQLEQWGALRRVWKQGDRKDYYEAVSDISALLNNGILETLDKKLNSAQAQIEQCQELLAQSADGHPEKVKHMQTRLQEAEKYRSRFSSLLNNKMLRKMI